MGGRRKTREGISSQEEWVSLRTCVNQFAGAFGYMPLVDSLLRYYLACFSIVWLFHQFSHRFYIHHLIQAGPSALQGPSVKSKKEVQGIGGSAMRPLQGGIVVERGLQEITSNIEALGARRRAPVTFGRRSGPKPDLGKDLPELKD